MVALAARRLALAALAAVAVAAAVAPPAGARTLTCELSATGTFNPPMRSPFNGVQTSGYYSFATPGGLTGVTLCSLDGAPPVPSTMVSGGRFFSAPCGTIGFSTDGEHDTTIDVGNDGTIDVTDVYYIIEAVEWQGLLDVYEVAGRPTQPPMVHDGVLEIRPQHPCTFLSVTRFTLDGAFTITW